jgi:hypothetical protein
MSTQIKTIIFSIDDLSHAGLLEFRAFILNSGFETRHIKPLIGCYKGQEEPSFVVAEDMFEEYIRGSRFIAEQESILSVTGCNKMYAVLEYLECGTTVGLGSMQCVSEEVARSFDAWSFDPTTNNWFICLHGNPDHAKDIKVQV